MARKLLKKKTFGLVISLLILCLVVWAHNFTVDKAMAVSKTFSIEVGNATPSVDWTAMTGFHNGVTTITPTEWAAAGDGAFIVTTTFAVSDANGYADISTTTIFVYRSDVGIANCGAGTSTDYSHCYPSTSTSSVWNPTDGDGDTCSRYSVSGNYAYFWCTTTLYYVADPTDAGTYSASSWVVYASTSDLSWAQANSEYSAATIDIATNRAIAVSPDSITYSTLSAGNDSGTTWATTTATTTGNIAVDIHFYGGSLTHTTNNAYHIPAFKQQFSTTSGLTYGDAGLAWLATTTGAASDGVTHDVTIAKATTTVPGPTCADKIYWGIGIPAGQLSGTYSSTTNFIATSTLVNP